MGGKNEEQNLKRNNYPDHGRDYNQGHWLLIPDLFGECIGGYQSWNLSNGISGLYYLLYHICFWITDSGFTIDLRSQIESALKSPEMRDHFFPILFHQSFSWVIFFLGLD